MMGIHFNTSERLQSLGRKKHLVLGRLTKELKVRALYYFKCCSSN